MRFLKKYIRKLYHLIWFLSLFILFVTPVDAELTNPNTNGTAVLTPYSIAFADNSSNVLTRVTSGWDDKNKRGWSNPITLNGSSSYGANVAFDTLQPFVAGYTYAVTILIGFSGTAHAVPTGGKVCVAETLNNAFTRFDSRYGWSCPSAQMHGTSGTPATWNVTDSNTGNQLYFGMLTYVFTSDTTATSVTMSFNSSTYLNQTTIYFGGYMMEVLSDNKNLTQQQITSAVQNSGLATASSVTQVQQSITQVQQQLGGVKDSIDDVNDTLNDSSVDSSDNTINSLKNQLPTNSVISDLMLLPVTMLSSLVNAIDGSCSTFSLGSLYGTNIYMPCIDIEDYVGSSIWTFIDIVFSAMFILIIRKTFLKIFHNITNLRTGANEVD